MGCTYSLWGHFLCPHKPNGFKNILNSVFLKTGKVLYHSDKHSNFKNWMKNEFLVKMTWGEDEVGSHPRMHVSLCNMTSRSRVRLVKPCLMNQQGQLNINSSFSPCLISHRVIIIFFLIKMVMFCGLSNLSDTWICALPEPGEWWAHFCPPPESLRSLFLQEYAHDPKIWHEWRGCPLKANLQKGTL